MTAITYQDRGVPMPADLRIENKETLNLLAGSARVFTEQAETLRPSVNRLNHEIEQLEAKLRVLTPQRDQQTAKLRQAEAEARDLARIIEAACAANGLPLPIQKTGQETSQFEAVDAQEAQGKPQTPPQGWAPVDPRPQQARTPEWANGPDAEQKLDGFLSPDSEFDEADGPKDDDEDPPAGEAASGEAKPRLVQQMKNRATQAMSALFSWPLGRGRHIAVRTT